jgi:uncharacterized protein YndB with AHSA1/START domain
MSEQTTQTQSVVIERELPHQPEKVWRALTQKPLIQEWLMDNDFQPVVDHKFKFTADWGSVEGQVIAVEPDKTLSYTWSAYGMESLVTWTLSPTTSGTHLRMEHSGFQPDQEKAYKGAQYGWAKFLDKLEEVVGKLD